MSLLLSLIILPLLSLYKPKLSAPATRKLGRPLRHSSAGRSTRDDLATLLNELWNFQAPFTRPSDEGYVFKYIEEIYLDRARVATASVTLSSVGASDESSVEDEADDELLQPLEGGDDLDASFGEDEQNAKAARKARRHYLRLARGLGNFFVPSTRRFWPTELLKKLKAVFGITYQQLCTDILSQLQVFFSEVTLDQTAELLTLDFETSRDLYNTEALASFVGFAHIWLERSNVDQDTLLSKWQRQLLDQAALTKAVENTRRDRYVLGHGRQDLGGALEALSADLKVEDVRQKLNSLTTNILERERTVASNIKTRLETVEDEIQQRLLRTFETTVEEEGGMPQQLFETHLSLLATTTSPIPPQVRTIMAALRNYIDDTFVEEGMEDILMILRDRRETMPQPLLQPAIVALKQRFDRDLAELASEREVLAAREEEVRARGESLGWIRADGGERLGTEATTPMHEARLHEREALDKLIEQRVGEQSADLARAIETKTQQIRDGYGISLRDDMLSAAHDVLNMLMSESPQWRAATGGDIYRVIRARDEFLLTTFASAVASTINATQVRSGGRGYYLQTAVYGMNAEQKRVFIDRLLNMQVFSLL